MFTLYNVSNGETIHQRCLLVSGHVAEHSKQDGNVSVDTEDACGQVAFPQQHWPLCQGYFKILLFLNPGTNVITIRANVESTDSMLQPAQKRQRTDKPKHVPVETKLRLEYIPLLQVPPLHLAILVAKDSPLRIDCPASKFGDLTSTHSDIESAVAKLRLTAYMWQALTAEDMRHKGLGRRAFRLEEEWGADTLSRVYLDAQHNSNPHASMQSTAKVHVIRTDLSTTELRDAQKAQQNANAHDRDAMHRIFTQALKKHGGVFAAKSRPIVAGLILDSHYDVEQDLILAHAALGAHDPRGLSLGVFGSHLTYAWPRFVEEVPACLLDTRSPGDLVGNDNGECTSMWEACAVGQGAFLHEVGHAFSAPHTSGIMERGYSPDWPVPFLARTARCITQDKDGHYPVTSETKHGCVWDIRDALRFRNLSHFRLPTDAARSPKTTPKSPQVDLEDDEDFARIRVWAEDGIARIFFNQQAEASPSIAEPANELRFTHAELEARFDPTKPLEIEILGMNGQHRTLNAWRAFDNRTFVRVPGTSIKLLKQSVGVASEEGNDQRRWTWATMLKKRDHQGNLVRATKLELRIGCIFDGAIMHYAGGERVNCGPRWNSSGHLFSMGGNSYNLDLTTASEVTKIRVLPEDNSWNGVLHSISIRMADGKTAGRLEHASDDKVEVMEPAAGYHVVGFYGASTEYGYCVEFGIITAPKDAELPDSVWDLPELRNIDGGLGPRKNHEDDYIRDNDDEDDEMVDSDDNEDENEDNEHDLDC